VGEPVDGAEVRGPSSLVAARNCVSPPKVSANSAINDVAAGVLRWPASSEASMNVPRRSRRDPGWTAPPRASARSGSARSTLSGYPDHCCSRAAGRPCRDRRSAGLARPALNAVRMLWSCCRFIPVASWGPRHC
jgi:hypothetical protein